MNAFIGLLLSVVGGAFMGAFTFPMKKTTQWAYENVWLVFVTTLAILPWIIAAITVPNLTSVYSNAGTLALTTVFLFGFGWGLGNVCFGLGVSMVGMGIGFATIMGLTTALGALVPMATNPKVFTTPGGMTITAGVTVMVVGVVVCAFAGNLKELQISKSSGGQVQAATRNYAKGIVVCILSGVFSPMMSYAFNFGGGIKDAAVAGGASSGGASDAIWAIALMGGFLANAIYCLTLLFKNRTWSNYAKPGTGSHWPLGMAIAFLWMAGIALYGRGSLLMGSLGGSAGWAIFLGISIVVSNILGVVSGEWKDGMGKPIRTMYGGLVVLLIAAAIIGYGNALPK